jgi:hypothetical protein
MCLNLPLNALTDLVYQNEIAKVWKMDTEHIVDLSVSILVALHLILVYTAQNWDP